VIVRRATSASSVVDNNSSSAPPIIANSTNPQTFYGVYQPLAGCQVERKLGFNKNSGEFHLLLCKRVNGFPGNAKQSGIKAN
jgi:hypothetical protein